MYNNLRLCLLGNVLVLVLLYINNAAASENAPVFETVHNSNAAILNRLGLMPLRIPPGHHKKRLAGPEPASNSPLKIHDQYGRRHSHRDSHVYIVKLPPNPPYYAFTRPHKTIQEDENAKKPIRKPSLPVGFHSNGKPGRIYHWNLPVMQKMAEKKRVFELEKRNHEKKQKNNVENSIKKLEDQRINKLKKDSLEDLNLSLHNNLWKLTSSQTGNGDNDVVPKNWASFEKHARNNDKRLSYPVGNFEDEEMKEKKITKQNSNKKNYRLEDSPLHKVKSAPSAGPALWSSPNDIRENSKNSKVQKVKKHRKKSAMSYYAPMSVKSGSSSFQKNFAGNGKPKAFYVMEKSSKPVYYHPLLP